MSGKAYFMCEEKGKLCEILPQIELEGESCAKHSHGLCIHLRFTHKNFDVLCEAVVKERAETSFSHKMDEHGAQKEGSMCGIKNFPHRIGGQAQKQESFSHTNVARSYRNVRPVYKKD